MLKLTEPFDRAVYQRDNSNKAIIPIVGTATPGATITATLTLQKVGAIQTLEYALPISQTLTANTDGSFSGGVSVPGGWYTVAVSDGTTQSSVKAGAGEVFIIWGHSFMQTRLGPASTDERVSTLSDIVTETNNHFEQLTARVGPFHTDGPGPWGNLGDKLVARLNVPVLFYGCAFGGSNIDQNYKVINNIPFQHSFIDYNKRMPYRPLEKVMQDYVPKTGLRAILMEHGYNDSSLDPTTFNDELNAVIDYTRNHFGHPSLPIVMVQEETALIPGLLGSQAIAQVEKTFIANKPNVWKGPDFDNGYWSTPGYHDNTGHLTITGNAQFASDWDASLTSAFFSNSQPVLSQAISTAGGTNTNGTPVMQAPTVQGENVNYILYGLAALFLLGVLSGRHKQRSWLGLIVIAVVYIYRQRTAPVATLAQS